mmetsp:Transcript_83565/g.139484  ORF Transcript_83565/g.139484 Transcript_83565/m.139484 type:complete len:326 (+) Transcript_83565:1017-1994(+)
MLATCVEAANASTCSARSSSRTSSAKCASAFSSRRVTASGNVIANVACGLVMLGAVDSISMSSLRRWSSCSGLDTNTRRPFSDLSPFSLRCTVSCASSYSSFTILPRNRYLPCGSSFCIASITIASFVDMVSRCCSSMFGSVNLCSSLLGTICESKRQMLLVAMSSVCGSLPSPRACSSSAASAPPRFSLNWLSVATTTTRTLDASISVNAFNSALWNWMIRLCTSPRLAVSYSPGMSTSNRPFRSTCPETWRVIERDSCPMAPMADPGASARTRSMTLCACFLPSGPVTTLSWVLSALPRRWWIRVVFPAPVLPTTTTMSLLRI